MNNLREVKSHSTTPKVYTFDFQKYILLISKTRGLTE